MACHVASEISIGQACVDPCQSMSVVPVPVHSSVYADASVSNAITCLWRHACVGQSHPTVHAMLPTAWVVTVRMTAVPHAGNR